jgi:5-oxoprolinase (ATP-hydrolysing)
VIIGNVQLVRAGRLLEPQARAILASGPYPCRNPDQNIADLKAQVAANETGKRELLSIWPIWAMSRTMPKNRCAG